MSEGDYSQEMDLSYHNMAWLVESFARSWSQRVRRLREKIQGERSNEVDRIYNEVTDQANRIVVKHEKPEEAMIEIYGVRIKKTIVHSKSEKYNGADVYIEVEDQKFALVQFKLQNGGRFQFDTQQLSRLSVWCDYCVQDRNRPLPCPSFVWLIDDFSSYHDKHRILKLCQLQNLLAGRNSASVEELGDYGITRSAFKELLVKCWVGAPFQRKPTVQELLDYSQSLRRLVVAFIVSRASDNR
jgi:hypothetical protein